MHFVPAPGKGRSQRAVIHNDDGDDFVARRVPEAIPPLPPDMSDPSAFIGDYWSPELGVLYRIRQQDGTLWLRYPRDEAQLRPEAQDVFLWRQDGISVRFVREAGNVFGFLLTLPNQRVRDLRFTKVAMIDDGRKNADFDTMP